MTSLREHGPAGQTVLAVAASAALLAACAGPRFAADEQVSGGVGSAPAPSGHALHGTDKPYEINGRWYYPKAQPDYDQIGLASWYGYGASETYHHTANGETFDQWGLSAAHRTLPLPSIVEVTNLANGRSIRLRLNDRGPFVDGRLIDLSRGAAEKLGFDRQGLARVRVRYVGAAPPLAAQGVMQAKLTPRHAVIATPQPTPVLSAAPLAGSQSQTDAESQARYGPAPNYAWAPGYGPAINRAPAAASAHPSSAPPEPVETAALPAPAPIQEADYRVQVGAYATREDAARAASGLGDNVRYRIEPVSRDGAPAYRVVLGGFLDEDDALAAQMRFAEAGFIDARVLKPF